MCWLKLKRTATERGGDKNGSGYQRQQRRISESPARTD